MAKVCTYLKNDGHKVRVGYVSLAGLEALDNRGVNSMSEAVPGKRVWLIVYDENRPCKCQRNRKPLSRGSMSVRMIVTVGMRCGFSASVNGVQ